MESSKFLVNGVWRGSGVTRSVVNPFTNRVVGEVCQASEGDIDLAITAAVQAFARTRRLSSHDRSTALFFIARELEAEKERLAKLITAETGKPITFSRTEVDRSVFTFLTAAEEAKRIEGVVLPLDLAANSGNRIGLVRRFPLGPVGAITPFNFPLNLVAHKVGPALAAGNTVVLKPSSSAPLIALALAEIVSRSGLPEGSINVVPCLAGESNQLIVDKRVKLLSFTGSPSVGWSLKERAGKKRVLLELGGNAGVIVDKDADLEYALQRIALGAYGNAGQSCIAVQRVFVHESVFAGFLERFISLSAAQPAGDPEDSRTVVGPMITEKAAQKVEEWIAEAVAGGARLQCGGRRKGALLEPTVLTDVRATMNVCAREVFAPVATVEPFRDFTQAIGMVNDSLYGLQAGVFTNSMSNVLQAFEELEVGGVMVNDAPTYRIDHMPYGGVKDSGFGREGIRYAIEEMTELKLLALNILP
jgi:acyl-CoA reductase-like NAD-dependent aldehyde dehydrogenase